MNKNSKRMVIGESLGVMIVKGIVTSTMPSRTFRAKSVRGKTVQDYYHIIMETDKGNFAKIYFPIATYSTRKRFQGRSIDIQVYNNKNQTWIKYDLKNPKLLVGKEIEVSGEVKKEGIKNYYINHVTSMKIF